MIRGNEGEMTQEKEEEEMTIKEKGVISRGIGEITEIGVVQGTGENQERKGIIDKINIELQ